MGKIFTGNILAGKVLGGKKRWAKYFVGNATGRQSTIDPIGIFLGLSTISVLDILIEFFNFINRKYFENGKKRMTKTNGAKDASNP